MLEIPPSGLIPGSNIMLVGIGGGFDVFVGLPFVYAWPEINFILVNNSPYETFHYRPTTPEDFPETSLKIENNIKAVYTVGKHGFGLVHKAYQEIAEKHNIDTVFAMDGGVDSLSTGDEQDPGTILEDFIGLAALQDFKYKTLCCAGFGTETEENLNHYRILENIAVLIREGGFIGAFSLTQRMPEFQKYKEQCELAWADGKRKSHIQTKIISAVNGKFGKENDYTNIDPRVVNSTGISFVSALSSIYWVFDLETVVKQNKIIPTLKKSNTFTDAKILLRNSLDDFPRRSHEPLPL